MRVGNYSLTRIMWFEALTGFRGPSPEEVRANLVVDGDTLTSRVNGRVMTFGRLEVPSLAELRERVAACDAPVGQLQVREVVADVQALHADLANAGALFQVASQFTAQDGLADCDTRRWCEWL
ncbi:MAG: hypothetical protein RhofKO_42440 [Rhodothermales bacterium]